VRIFQRGWRKKNNMTNLKWSNRLFWRWTLMFMYLGCVELLIMGRDYFRSNRRFCSPGCARPRLLNHFEILISQGFCGFQHSNIILNFVKSKSPPRMINYTWSYFLNISCFVHLCKEDLQSAVHVEKTLRIVHARRFHVNLVSCFSSAIRNKYIGACTC
jgi:hypothetical protein